MGFFANLFRIWRRLIRTTVGRSAVMANLMDEIKLGFASGFVVLVGKCVDTGTEWKVERSGLDPNEWISVKKADVLQGPTAAEVGTIGFDGFSAAQPLQSIRVKLGAEAKVRHQSKDWQTRLWYARDRSVAVGFSIDRESFSSCGILFNRHSFDPIGVAYGNWDYGPTQPNEGF